MREKGKTKGKPGEAKKEGGSTRNEALCVMGLSELIEFKARHGHINMSISTCETGLAQWLNDQKLLTNPDRKFTHDNMSIEDKLKLLRDVDVEATKQL